MSGTPPLRLRPPTRTADAALGERLAELARASRPTTARLRTHRWAAPVAGVALLVASGGVAWGTHAEAHHTRHPIVVPGVQLAPVPTPEQAAVARTVAAPARAVRPTSLPSTVDRPAAGHDTAGDHRSPAEDSAGRGPGQGDLTPSSDDGRTSDEVQPGGHDSGRTGWPRPTGGPTSGTAHEAASGPSAGDNGAPSCADPGNSCD